MSETTRIVAPPIRIREAKSTQIELENTGQPANVGDTPHQLTNHYIAQSREYFPRSVLRTYFCGCSYLRCCSVLCLLASFLGAVSANRSQGKGAAALFFVIDVLWIAIFIQHECVNRKSLPVVLQQPVFAQQRKLNTFYTLTVRELSGVTLENYNAGIGFVKSSQGSIKFQAFNPRAVQDMRDARRFSRIMLFMFLCLSAYNMYFCVM